MRKQTIGVAAVVSLALVVVVLAGDQNHPAASADLAAAGPPRPGPGVLYSPAPVAPQLQSRGPWFRAAPILISATEAYEGGEYLYQDHLYDDYGADTGGDDPVGTASAGDVAYPPDPARYGNNGADLVEFRVSVAEPEEVAYRFTLNTLLAPDAAMAVVAFDTDDDPATGGDRLPLQPGAPFPGTDEMITTWGTGASHNRFVAGAWVTTPVDVHADVEANQLTVVVPRSLSDPTGSPTATVAVGLHDRASGGWLLPASPAPGIYNLAFRFDEPVGTAAVPPDAAQAEALADGEPTRFAHAIDFDALAAGADVAPAPERTTQIRIFPSALRLGEGRDFSRFPQYRGQLQPYSLTVPSAYREGEPSPFTLNLHSLTRHHWQYHGSEGLAQIGEELDTLVLTPLARGVNGWYQHEAEFDVFEAWADVARHYDLDAERVAVAGYSMGGYGAYRLATLYPDLFGRAMTVVGPPGEGAWSPGSAPTGGVETLTNRWLASARHVPFLNVVAARDVVVPIAGTRAQSVGTTGFVDVGGFEQLGYRYRYVEYPEADHHTLAVLGYGLPMATDFLSRTRVVDGPARVTYVVAPGADDPALGLVHDHAYWVSGLRLAPTVGGPDRTGRIDAYSWASGVREPSSRLRRGGGDEPLAYTEQYRTWSGPPKAPAGNRLDVTLANLYSARLELEAAGLSTAHDLVVKVSSDAAAVLFLAGDWKPGTAVFGPDGKPVDGAFLVEGGLYLPVSPGSHGYTVRPGSGPPD